MAHREPKPYEPGLLVKGRKGLMVTAAVFALGGHAALGFWAWERPIATVSGVGEAEVRMMRVKRVPMEDYAYNNLDERVTDDQGPTFEDLTQQAIESTRDEILSEWDTLDEQGRRLHLLNPTDSCRDRLAAFFHFLDRSALDQALAIHAAQSRLVDMDRIRTWARREGQVARFEEFQGLALR